MGYNKKVLSEAIANLNKRAAPARKKDAVKIIDKEGQRKHPGQVTTILGDSMATDGYGDIPLMVYPNNGQPPQLVEANTGPRYFPGATEFTEVPVAKKGGEKKYSRSLTATNKLFKKNPLVEKKKSKKRKIFDPNAKYYQGGGDISIPDLNQYEDGGEYDLTDYQIAELKKGGWIVEELPKAQFGNQQQGSIKISPFDYHGETPGMYRFDTENPTFNIGYSQPLGKRARNFVGADSISAGLTTMLPYKNNTGVGIQGNIHTDFDEFQNLPARVEGDLLAGYDPNLGGYASLMASPQFMFGNVPQTVARRYGTGLKSGEFMGSVGPFAGASYTPNRAYKNERVAIPAGVKGNIDFGIGRKGIKAGLSGYAGADMFGTGLKENKDSMGKLIPRFNYGLQANLKIPINPVKDYAKDLIDIAREKINLSPGDNSETYRPRIKEGGLTKAQSGRAAGTGRCPKGWVWNSKLKMCVQKNYNNPYVITDPDEYNRRVDAYADSSILYNTYTKMKNLSADSWQYKKPLTDKLGKAQFVNLNPVANIGALRAINKSTSFSDHYIDPKAIGKIKPINTITINTYAPANPSGRQPWRVDEYMAPQQYFIYKKLPEGSEEPEFTSTIPEIGRLPVKTISQPETPELIQRNLIPEPINYDPIRTAKRLQTVMEPDPNKPGEYKIKDFKQVPYSAYFPGEGWQPMDAPGVAWINEKGEEVYEDPTRNKKNGGLIKKQKGGMYYTYPGSEGVYRKVGNKWEVDWNRSGNFQPLSKGDVAERTAKLNKGAKQLFDQDYYDLVENRNQAFQSAPAKQVAKKPTAQQIAAQKVFDKDFKVTGKSNYEKVEDQIQKDIQEAKKLYEQSGLEWTKADEDEITNRRWNLSGVGTQYDPGVIQTPSKSTTYFNAPENPTFGDYAGKAWDIITNPIDYFNYSVATGDMMNAPWDITDYERALDKLGEEDPILSRNAVGKGLDLASYFNPATAVLQAIKTAAEIPGLIGKARQTGDWSDAGWALGETALEMIPGMGAADDLARASKYLTTQTPLKNTYKINPFALKENPEMFLYRAEPTDFNSQSTIDFMKQEVAAGREKPWYRGTIKSYEEGHPKLIAQNDFHGQWFEKDPNRLDFYLKSGDKYDVGTPMNIIRKKLPTSEADKFSVVNNPKANVISASPETEFVLPRDMVNSAEIFPESSWQQLIQEDKAFNTPHWLKGYKKTDVPKELPGSGNKTGMTEVVMSDVANVPITNEELLRSNQSFNQAVAERLSLWQSPEGRRRLANFGENELNLYGRGFTDILTNSPRAIDPDTYILNLSNTINTEGELLDAYNAIKSVEDAYNQGKMTLEEAHNFATSYKNLKKHIKKSIDKYNATQEGIISKGRQSKLNPNIISIGPGMSANEGIRAGRHEIIHVLQNDQITHLDEKLNSLDLLDDADLPANTYTADPTVENQFSNITLSDPDYYKKSKDYWDKGSFGREKLTMTEDVRSDLLESGKIKSLYDNITPEMLETHYKEYLANREGRFPLRVFDVMKNKLENFKLLSNVMNEMPALIPGIMGAGALGAAGSLGTNTNSQKEYKDGGIILDIDQNDIQRYIDQGYIVEFDEGGFVPSVTPKFVTNTPKQLPKKEQPVTKEQTLQPSENSLNTNVRLIKPSSTSLGMTEYSRNLLASREAVPIEELQKRYSKPEPKPKPVPTSLGMTEYSKNLLTDREKIPIEELQKRYSKPVPKAKSEESDFGFSGLGNLGKPPLGPTPTSKMSTQPIAGGMGSQITNVGTSGVVDQKLLSKVEKEVAKLNEKNKNLKEVIPQGALESLHKKIYNASLEDPYKTENRIRERANVYWQYLKRAAVKEGIIPAEEAIVKLDKNVPKPKITPEKPKVDEFYQEIATVPDNYTDADSLMSYRNQWDNNKGFVYIATPVKKDRKSSDVYKNVKGVGHFLLDASANPDFKYSHEYNKKMIDNAIANNDWIPTFQPVKGDRVKLQYKKPSEILEDDEVLTPLRQMKFSDIRFDKTKRPEGFNTSIKEVTKNDGQGTYLIFKNRDAYSRFSGGSVVFIFKDKFNNTIVRDFAGSLNQIENEGLQIQKQYNLKPEDLTLGYHDVGSFSAKPKANSKGELKASQWEGFNPHDWTGGALLIPND